MKYFLLATILVGAPLGLPLVGYFDPFSTLFRAFAFAIDPLFTELVKAPFDWLYVDRGELMGRVQALGGRAQALFESTDRGEYLARVEVDGVASRLSTEDESTSADFGRYVEPRITIP